MIQSASNTDFYFSTEKPSGYIHHPKYLYAFEDFRVLNKTPERAFYLLNAPDKTIVGTSFFYRKENEWLSPLKAPFGGFDIRNAPQYIIAEFVEFVLSSLLSGIIRLRLFPQSYDPELSRFLHEELIKNGFEVITQEPNHHVEVDKTPMEEKIHKMEQRKLNACLEQNFSFLEEDVSQTGEIYDFIEECRNELNYSVSMTREEIWEAVNQIPGHYQFFSVKDGNKRVAACISVVVNEEIVYNFYPASVKEYNKYSPSVFLNCGIYRFCQNHGYRMMDLGTSFLNGKPNESLISFKEKLGASASLRVSYKRV